jgi:hypothetical protein
MRPVEVAGLEVAAVGSDPETGVEAAHGQVVEYDPDGFVGGAAGGAQRHRHVQPVDHHVVVLARPGANAPRRAP